MLPPIFFVLSNSLVPFNVVAPGPPSWLGRRGADYRGSANLHKNTEQARNRKKGRKPKNASKRPGAIYHLPHAENVRDRRFLSNLQSVNETFMGRQGISWH